MIQKLEQFIRSFLEAIHTKSVGKLVDWNASSHRATVKPKLKKELGDREQDQVTRQPPEGGKRDALSDDVGDAGQGKGQPRRFPGTGQTFSPRSVDTHQELDGPPLYETPDVIWFNADYGQYFPWDDDTPLLLGFLGRDSDEALADMGSRTPPTDRQNHVSDAVILGAMVPDNASEPNWGKDLVLAYSRANTAKHLRFTPEQIWYMVGKKLNLIANDGEIKLWNDASDRGYHQNPDGSTTLSGASMSLESDDGDVSVNDRGLLAELDDLKQRVSDLEG